ncbi:GAF domain-containing protein [Arthrobacter sp. B0490]|uniref:GAF domain-containing protein n=1 Tax=Arthrobacter sp. B0490 TaxID=2058891 RepID=UPI000CE54757|nr:GAF domain-containing protein [Arthrobacter sp. B0490]
MVTPLPLERTLSLPTPSSFAAAARSDLQGSPAREAERQRLRSLDRLGLLDSGDEERFDRLTRRAQAHFGVTTAVISLVGADRQYLKSFVGSFPRNVQRDAAFCNVTLQGEDPLVVSDLRADERFQHNPLVVGAPFIRFYAGVPLRGPGGWFVGSLCILDTRPRDLDGHGLLQLHRLADEAELEVNAEVLGSPPAEAGSYALGAKSSSAMSSGSRNSRM